MEMSIPIPFFPGTSASAPLRDSGSLGDPSSLDSAWPSRGYGSFLTYLQLVFRIWCQHALHLNGGDDWFHAVNLVMISVG